MPGIENLYLFIVAGLLLNVTPGPDMMYVATRSASQGRQAGVASAFGIAAGGFVHTAAAALGLSVLLVYSALAFTVVKWMGAAYLVYLGVRILLTARRPLETQRVRTESVGAIFRQGVVINVLNPKVALFFLAFLPQFADPAAGSFAWQILLLGTLFNVTGTLVNVLVAYGAGSFGQWVAARPKAQHAQSWLTGLLFIGLGIGLALSDRK